MAESSGNRKQAEATLPDDPRETFGPLVADYQSAAEKHVGKVWVNYDLLADLVRSGWRKMYEFQ